MLVLEVLYTFDHSAMRPRLYTHLHDLPPVHALLVGVGSCCWFYTLFTRAGTIQSLIRTSPTVHASLVGVGSCYVVVCFYSAWLAAQVYMFGAL